jgi:aminopeptidase N
VRAGDRSVFVDAAYDPLAESFRTVADEARITVEMLSNDFPGIPFPYPFMTVFNGYYGMEFPMIVNDGEFPNRISNVYVHAHEITHSYFPFMVGINETRYAWMDEGMAYFLPVGIQKKLSDYDHMIRAARGYERFAGTERDYPLLIPATASGGNELQILGYIKPALAFAVLRDAMGSGKFDAALREFVRRWEGKHPLPWDFFHTFNHVNGENLDWFWKPWFFDFGWPDLAITDVRTESGITTVTVQREGSMPVPVRMQVTLQGGQKQDIEQSAALWKSGSNVVEFRVDHDLPITSIRLGAGWIPDANPRNNEWAP